MDAHCFAAAANYQIDAGTMSGFMGRSADAVRETSLQGAIRRYEFYLRAFSGSPMPGTAPTDAGAPLAPRSNGWRAV